MLFGSHIRKRVAWCIFTLFALMQLNVIVFRHAHRLPNGRIITHAHPFKPIGNNPIQPLNHTDNELLSLDLLTHPICETLDFDTFEFSAYVSFRGSVIFCYKANFFAQAIRWFSLRGPPLFG